MTLIAFSAFQGPHPAVSSWGYGRSLRCWFARVHRVRIAVICIATLLFGVAEARAEPWDRLPDGRVIIQVKDVRLGLPAAGADTNLVRFRDTKTHRSMSLKDVIVRPEEARDLFNKADKVDLSLPNLHEQPGLLLGKFSRVEFRTFRSDLLIGDKVDANCSYWEQHFLELRQQLSPADSRIGPEGWAEFKDTVNPPSWSFVRVAPGQDDVGWFLGVSCNFTDTCGSTKCIGPRISFSYQFSRRAFRQEAWAALNLRVHQLLHFVLIDIPK